MRSEIPDDQLCRLAFGVRREVEISLDLGRSRRGVMV